MKQFLSKLTIFLFCFSCVSKLQAQVVASFDVPDTVCLNAPINIINSSTNATSYYWNFCTADINAKPLSNSFGNVGNMLGIPVFVDYAYENGNYYGFLVNNSPGGLIKLDFGNSLLNTPVATNLGNFGGVIPVSAQGIQVVKEGSSWFAIIVGGDPVINVASRILKIDFGANLSNNNPIATNWGNIGGLNYPVDIYVFKEGTNWYGITVNYRDNSLTRFSFGASFNNPPTGINLGSLGGMFLPSGICPINDNGTWRVFVANYGNSSLSRIDFGNSLLNAPTTATNLGSLGNTMNTPRDIFIFNYCNQIVGFVVNDNTADIVRLNFSTLSTVPSATSLGKIGGTNNPHSISKIFREGGNLFAFLPNSQTNGLSRIQFSGCANSSIPSSTIQNPGAIQYNASGTYNITLSVDEGLPTQTSYCKSIKVTQPVPLVASSDTSICLGDSILLNVNGGVGYKWIPTTNLSNPNVSNPIIKPIVSTQYIVSAINSSQCFSNDTVQVDVKQPPVFTLTPNAVSICKFDSVQLIATGGDIYSWSSASPLPTSQGNNFFVKPPTTSVFTVVAQTLQCSFKDTLATTIVVNPLPIINLSKSNDLDCVNGSAQLVASGGVRYVWTPTTGLSNPSISNPIVTGAISGKYYVEVSTLAGCKSKDSVELLSISNPLVDRFFMPSGFTPNGDRLNDCFGIKKWGTIVELDFKIFNRWGQLVFYTNTADKCWDGKYKGVMQDAGAFVYTIHAKTLCGRVDKKGSFILIR